MCIILRINMSDILGMNNVEYEEKKFDIKQIVKDTEDGEIGIYDILRKHKITLYKYNQILKLAEIKKTYIKSKKSTQFKKICILLSLKFLHLAKMYSQLSRFKC